VFFLISDRLASGLPLLFMASWLSFILLLPGSLEDEEEGQPGRPASQK